MVSVHVCLLISMQLHVKFSMIVLRMYGYE